SSSSTTETTDLSRASMRSSLSSVHVGVESICYQARSSGGTRLPYLDRVGLLPPGNPIASPLTVRLVERRLQSLRELRGDIHGPEVHIEEARHIEEPMVVDRGHVDAVLPQRL